MTVRRKMKAEMRKFLRLILRVYHPISRKPFFLETGIDFERELLDVLDVQIDVPEEFDNEFL